MEDRRTDDDTRDRLSKIQKGYEKFATKTYEILAVIVLAVMALGAFGYWFIRENRERSQDVQRLVMQIQQQRRDFVRQGCEETNARHDATVGLLNARYANSVRIAETPEQREQIKQSQQFVVLLVDALTPKRDCAQEVREATQGGEMTEETPTDPDELTPDEPEGPDNEEDEDVVPPSTEVPPPPPSSDS